MALVGSMIAPEYAHLQSCCYSEARKYIELCERDDDETSIMSLNAFQALLFIIRYELTKKHFVRAWMTLGRAVTLAQILNLHHIDDVDATRHQRTGPQRNAIETGYVRDIRYSRSSLDGGNPTFVLVFIHLRKLWERSHRPTLHPRRGLLVYLSPISG